MSLIRQARLAAEAAAALDYLGERPPPQAAAHGVMNRLSSLGR